MQIRHILAATVAAAALIGLSGCAVERGQQSVGAYIDDTTITTKVKARFVDSRQVDAAAISVETLNGVVLLSGFAKNANERRIAGEIADDVKGVRQVRNQIVVRP